jgi:Mrp family chromosome partitioning ATPase
MEESHNCQAIESIYGHIERQKLRLIALCSPKEKSGNSLIALALARRAALAGRKVLLIEMNLQHPSQIKRCSAQLTQPTNSIQMWQNALYDTDQPGLQLLVAPEDDLPHTELKSQELLSAFFNQLLKEFDLVLCDTAPLLQPKSGNIPADMVCSACEGTIINVLTNVTTECQVAECSDVLKHCGAQLSGAVMNDNFAPSLQQELIRETFRLEKKLPKLMAWFRHKIRRSMIINQSL